MCVCWAGAAQPWRMNVLWVGAAQPWRCSALWVGAAQQLKWSALWVGAAQPWRWSVRSVGAGQRCRHGCMMGSNGSSHRNPVARPVASQIIRNFVGHEDTILVLCCMPFLRASNDFCTWPCNGNWEKVRDMNGNSSK